MRGDYNYKNCQSLFGYAYAVHLRSGGVCQLCDAGGGEPSFDLWRQLTVEHIIGKTHGGYLKDIKKAVSDLLPELSIAEQRELSVELDAANTVTACSFCNSTTSRDSSEASMRDLISESLKISRSPSEVVRRVAAETRKILERKRADVAWKLKAIRSQYEQGFLPSVSSNKSLYRTFEGGAVYTSQRGGRFLVVLDESTLSDVLPEEVDGAELVKTIEFASEAERSEYLLRRFGPSAR